ncbi:MAG: tetratricopeptide repeat protein [Candidatus Eremiobacteraeota bacterium]|nr:tetratricopeptide repeat protein [Candidatus Eremiobacteraeota bacterium]
MRRLLLSLVLSSALFNVAPLPACAQYSEAPGQTLFNGETPAQMMDRLRAQAVNGNLDGAISELSSFVRAHPDLIEPARLLGDFYYRKPDMVAAERVYKSIVARYPSDRETWNRLGGIYAAQDRVDEAIAAFDKSIPEPSAYPNLVELHRRRGDLPAFQRQIAADAERNPTDQRTLLTYGNVLRALHKYDDAIAVFKRALDLSPYRCPALNDLANGYLDIGRVGDALPLLERCLNLEPNAYFALVNIGEANIELGRYEKARPYLERAIKVRVDRPEAYVDIGYLEDVAHRWKSAVEFYQKAISADPLWRDAYIDLGYDYNEQKLYALAEAAFLKGLSVSPRDGRLSYMLGVTYNEQGKVALAKQQYRRAIDVSDEDIVVRAARRELAQLENQTPVQR